MKVKQLVEDYEKARTALAGYRSANYRYGQFVRVDSPRFKGIGMVDAFSDSAPSFLPVKLENDNTWHYPIADIVEVIRNPKDVPRSVRLMKLRWHGYRGYRA